VIVETNAHYPCCESRARFSKAEQAKGTVEKTCRRCRKQFTVKRRALVKATVGGASIHDLTWKEATTR
jgi:hypothetical protein